MRSSQARLVWLTAVALAKMATAVQPPDFMRVPAMAGANPPRAKPIWVPMAVPESR